MAHVERNGKRKTRDQMVKRRVPELGYYFIVTDTEETEQNYMYGLRNSIPKELQGKLVIKVIKTKSNNLVDEARNLASINPQYGEISVRFFHTVGSTSMIPRVLVCLSICISSKRLNGLERIFR